MILYVNGDSHSAAAEAVNPHCFANDDPNYTYLERKPHPKNLEASYGQLVADNLGYSLVCDAESASSNDRILRTTKTYLENNTPDLIIIGWSHWEREEWLYNDTYWQIVGSGISSDWPGAIKDKHKEWVLSLDYQSKLIEWHEKIWQLHLDLKDIPHLFFNCFKAFSISDQKDWGYSFINPYTYGFSYQEYLINCGFLTTAGQHFRADAHQAWANRLTKAINESIITT